ncbi:MAG: hypothetical protein ACRDAM_06880, partial [Casimicrobium sp.]
MCIPRKVRCDIATERILGFRVADRYKRATNRRWNSRIEAWGRELRAWRESNARRDIARICRSGSAATNVATLTGAIWRHWSR